MPSKKSRGRWESSEWWKIHRIGIVNEAFVTWACFCACAMDITWLVQTQVILYTTHGWSNRASVCFRSWYARVSLLGWFFEDISGDSRRICMVARKSNITSQCASAGINEVSRKNCFGFQFFFWRLAHAKQNFEVAENHYDDAKTQRIGIVNQAFVARARFCLLVMDLHGLFRHK